MFAYLARIKSELEPLSRMAEIAKFSALKGITLIQMRFVMAIGISFRNLKIVFQFIYLLHLSVMFLNH